MSKSSGLQKVAMILSSVVDLRVRGGIVPAHTGRLDKVASWVKSTRWLQAIAGVGLTSAALWHAAVVWASPPTETSTHTED